MRLKFDMRVQQFFFCALLVFVGAAAPWASAATLQDVETSILKKKFDHAQALAEEIISTTNSPAQKSRARYYAGLSLLRQSKYALARIQFKEILNGHPTPETAEQASLGLIDSFYLDGMYQAALNSAQEFLNRDPTPDSLSLVYLKMARTQLKLAQWPKAHSLLQKIIREFPNRLEEKTAQQLLLEKQYFAVQVGSFKERSMAAELLQELTQKGEYAYIVEVTSVTGQKFYRVRVGQLAALGEAQELETKLLKQGYPTMIYP